MLVVSDRIRIPLWEIVFRFVRSSGPGGQNVNKVSSKAVLRWPAAASPSLPDDVRGRFLERFASRVTAKGEVVLACDRHRDRERNRDDCLEKLRGMLAEVAAPPKPRRKTRASRGSVERRLESKRIRSEQKRQRSRVD